VLMRGKQFLLHYWWTHVLMMGKQFLLHYWQFLRP
jgi:hypothetical protein